jgi:hypothetical protein
MPVFGCRLQLCCWVISEFLWLGNLKFFIEVCRCPSENGGLILSLPFENWDRPPSEFSGAASVSARRNVHRRTGHGSQTMAHARRQRDTRPASGDLFMITVLIPAHNEAAGLGATLDSLNAQTVRPQRVVVICARWGILTGQNEMRRGLHPGSHPDIQTYE